MPASGQRFSHYQILEKLGGGGMGVVLKAQDIRLGRLVALKFLHEQFSRDPNALERFRREACAASALNHPNICTIHDIDQQEGVHFIVMEFMQGMPLKHKLQSQPIPIDEILDLAVQIADGLEAAHAKGIIHRDIKPANIFITDRGTAKILDFGLAKLQLGPRPGESAAPTAATEEMLTSPGNAMGTIAYMSPEQVRGEDLDLRTDVFSAGVVLYEMVTGKRPFEGATSGMMFNAILSQDPVDPVEFALQMPVELGNIIRKALEKDRKLRYQSSSDLRVDLERLKRDRDSGRVRRHRSRVSQPPQSRSSRARIRSLAVLPLANLSRDPEQEYFADGMTEELITSLAKIAALRVISRTSAMRYKRTEKSIPQVAQELNVDGIVEGSVRREGNRVRITAQLIQAATDQHVWAESYERDLSDILALQSEVARAIAREIQVTLTPQERARLTATRKVVPEAYELYLKGLQESARFSSEGFAKGIEYFEQSIRKDPDYAPSHASLAECCWGIGNWGLKPAKAIMPKAKAAAAKALTLDTSLAEAHASMAVIKWVYDWDWAGAEQDFRRAIELNPSRAIIHWQYARFLMTMNRLQESIHEATIARTLDPLSAGSALILALAYFFAHHQDQSIDHLKQVLELDPNSAFAHALLFWIFARRGMNREAFEAGQTAAALSAPGMDLIVDVWLAASHVLAGQPSEALKLAEIWQDLAARQFVEIAGIGLFHAWLGNLDEAFQCYQKAFEERSSHIPWFKTSPAVPDEMRRDARGQDLMRRIGFPD